MAWNLGLLGAASFTPPDFELISTTVLTANTASVTFSSIPQDYKHLQIRALVKQAGNGDNGANFTMTLNGATSGYARHRMFGNAASVLSDVLTSDSSIRFTNGAASSFNTFYSLHFTGMVTDILDYASTNKNTTIRSSFGFTATATATANTAQVTLLSGLLNSTSAITSLEISSFGNLAANCRFSLYGIKG